MTTTKLLIAVKHDDAKRYHKNLSAHDDFQAHIVTNTDDAVAVIADRSQHVDVFVIDNNMDGVFELISELRQTYPRLLIVLVDEEADFGMPGQADAMSTEPFENDDLVNQIRKMIADRRMETLRSDSLPAVRSISKRMRQASGVIGKQQAAMEACMDMGYDYAAYYDIKQKEPLQLSLGAQSGPKAIQSIAPKKSSVDDLMGWVAQNGQSRIAAPEDKPNHPLVARGRLGAVACVPVSFSEHDFGVIAACRDEPGTITQDNILMLELVATQLATVLLKEQ